MDYASTAFSVAMTIKGLVDKNAKNKKGLLRASVRLVDDIQNLEELRKGRISDSLPMPDKDIAVLQSNLHELLYDCDKIYKTKSGFGGYVKRMKARVFSADDIAQQIEEIRKEVDRAYTKFLAANGISNSISIAALGVEKDGAVLQESLDARISAAREDPAQAGALFGTDVMSTSEKKQALRRATLELGDVDEEKEAEHRILSVKVKAIRAALVNSNEMFRAGRAVPPDDYEISGSETFRPTFEDPVADRSNAVQETYFLLEALKKKDSEMSAITWFHRATGLSCVLGSSLGLRSEALLLSQMCYSISRRLAERNPAFFESELAMAMHNVSSDLSEMGKYQEALDAIQEAVQLYRKLAERSPEAFENNLARSLNNMSICLSYVGEHQKALDASQEAVQLYRKLAERSPEAFEKDLAMSLNNLSNHLSAIGEHQKAMDAIQEAVQLRRKLAERSPEVFEKDLAGSLNNLSLHSSDIGEYQKAIDTIQEAVQLYRKLALRSPETYEPDLGNALESFGDILKQAGRKNEAVVHLKESVDILEGYTSVCPGIVQEPYEDAIMSLKELGVE